MSSSSTGKTLLGEKCRHITQNFLEEPGQFPLHNTAPTGKSRGTYCSSRWKCWQLPILRFSDTLGWPGSSRWAPQGWLHLWTLLFCSFSLLSCSQGDLPIQKQAAKCNMASTSFPHKPSDGRVALPAFTLIEGSLPFLHKHIHSFTGRTACIRCPPFVTALFTVLDSRPSGIGTLGTAFQMTRHNYNAADTTTEEQQVPKWRSKHSLESH